MSKKVLFILGSLRKGSFNKSIVEYIKTELNSKGIETSNLDFGNMPFFNQDIEFPTPDSVEKVREEVKRADALWIVTPEYNGSVPGALKNLLDWLSRPIEQGIFGAPEFVKDKLISISGAAGKSEASLVLAELEGLLGRMGLRNLSIKTGLGLSSETFKTGEFVLSDDQKEKLDKQIAVFLKEL